MSKRYVIAFLIMFVASVSGSFVAGNQAGNAGAHAGKKEVEKEASKIATENAYQLVKSQNNISRKNCGSGNNFRKSVNNRTKALKDVSLIIKDFLQSAKIARLASASTGGPDKISNTLAAKSYSNLINKLDKIRFTDIKTRNCRKIYPTPVRP